MNKLDDKVIVDRNAFEVILEMAIFGVQNGYYGNAFYDDIERAQNALAADLTGWAAVPVNFNLKMYYAGADEKTVRETYRAMLAASPPLPGGGE